VLRFYIQSLPLDHRARVLPALKAFSCPLPGLLGARLFKLFIAALIEAATAAEPTTFTPTAWV
jgi:hypothetical protein